MTGFSVQPELVEGFVTVMNGEGVSPCNHRRVSPNSNLHQKSRFDPRDSSRVSPNSNLHQKSRFDPGDSSGDSSLEIPLTLEIAGDSALAPVIITLLLHHSSLTLDDPILVLIRARACGNALPSC